MKLEDIKRIRENRKKVREKMKTPALARSKTSKIVIETLKEFKNDEIGYKSALQKLKDSGCTDKEIKYFINNSLV